MTRILISNDDGYQAPGLEVLHHALRDIAHVEVIAPEHNNSAKSNALTIHSPLYVHCGHNGFRYVTGTPADSVHLALSGLLDYRPDLVVSGINNGANMGDDIIYSGTVAAATEGYLFGIPSIAFSQTQMGWAELEAAGQKAKELVQFVIGQNILGKKPWLLNVNIPNLPYAQLKPFRICRLGKRHTAEKASVQTNPRGQHMYWIGAAGVESDAAEDTDFHATRLGHIAVTPLQLDLTDFHALADWGQGMALLDQ